MNKEFKAMVFNKYIGARVEVKNERYVNGGYIGTLRGMQYDSPLVEFLGDNYEDIDNCTLILTRIEDMSYETILEVCAAACPELYGDFRFKKWAVVDRMDNDGTYIKVAREGDEGYFTINRGTAEVKIWGEELYDVNAMYTQVYFKNGVAVPLWFGLKHKDNNFTAIELLIAKTNVL